MDINHRLRSSTDLTNGSNCATCILDLPLILHHHFYEKKRCWLHGKRLSFSKLRGHERCCKRLFTGCLTSVVLRAHVTLPLTAISHLAYTCSGKLHAEPSPVLGVRSGSSTSHVCKRLYPRARGRRGFLGAVLQLNLRSSRRRRKNRFRANPVISDIQLMLEWLVKSKGSVHTIFWLLD